jgi:hypothetical protein
LPQYQFGDSKMVCENGYLHYDTILQLYRYCKKL